MVPWIAPGRTDAHLFALCRAALRLLLAMVVQTSEEPTKNAAREAGIVPRLHALISAPLPLPDGATVAHNGVTAADCAGATSDALVLLEALTTGNAANCAAVRSVQGQRAFAAAAAVPWRCVCARARGVGPVDPRLYVEPATSPLACGAAPTGMTEQLKVCAASEGTHAESAAKALWNLVRTATAREK